MHRKPSKCILTHDVSTQKLFIFASLYNSRYTCVNRIYKAFNFESAHILYKMNPRADFIDLGYMSIKKCVWRPFAYDDETDDESEKVIETSDGVIATSDGQSRDPYEIIIPFASAQLIFTRPFLHNLRFTFNADNEAGFTRREISEKIMIKYNGIFAEEDAALRACPDVLYGPYMIFGHKLKYLFLRSIQHTNDPDVFIVHVSSR